MNLKLKEVIPKFKYLKFLVESMSDGLQHHALKNPEVTGRALKYPHHNISVI